MRSAAMSLSTIVVVRSIRVTFPEPQTSAIRSKCLPVSVGTPIWLQIILLQHLICCFQFIRVSKEMFEDGRTIFPPIHARPKTIIDHAHYAMSEVRAFTFQLALSDPHILLVSVAPLTISLIFTSNIA